MKEPKSKKERRHPRIDFRLEVMIRGQKGFKTIQNFSPHGVFVHADNPLQFSIGDEVYLVMKFPHERKAIEVKTRVIHVSEQGIGVEFVDLLPKDAMTIEYCFNIFKHTVPLPGS